MDKIVLILIGIIVLFVVILLVRLAAFLFIPSINAFYAQATQRQIDEQLFERGFDYVNSRTVLNRKAKKLGYKLSFAEMISFKVIHFQFVEALNTSTRVSEYFWFKGSKVVWLHFLFPTQVEVFKEFDLEVIRSLKTWEFNEPLDIKEVDSNCPACKSAISTSDRQCPDCGLVFQ